MFYRFLLFYFSIFKIVKVPKLTVSSLPGVAVCCLGFAYFMTHPSRTEEKRQVLA